MINYEITKNAVFDIEEIWFWTIENFSEKQAEIYHLDLETVIKNLVIENSFEQYNFIRHKSHYIFYIHTSEEKIKIVRILHQNRNFTKFLK